MRKLKKKEIILGLICITIEIVLCGEFKEECIQTIHNKADQKKQNYIIPHNMNSSFKSKNGKQLDNRKLKKLLFAMCKWSKNTHLAYKRKTSNLVDSIDQIADIDTQYTHKEDITNAVSDNLETNSGFDSSSDLEPLAKKIDHINPVKIKHGTGFSKNTRLSAYKNENKFILRSYTNYISNICNFKLVYYGQIFNTSSIIKKSQKIISNWKKDRNTDIWSLIKDMNLSYFVKRRIFRTIFKKKIKIDWMPNPLYYNGFINDLSEYIKKHGSSLYSYIDINSGIRVKKKETIGDILSNKEVSLYCCCGGINSQIIEGTERDIKLKKKLNIILLIPEVYEDFYKMPQRAADNFVNKLNITGNNIEELSKTHNNIYTVALLNIKHIISYFMGTAQKNTELIESSYTEIQKIIFENQMIQYWDSTEVFALACAAVQIFYSHKFFLQQVSYDEQKIIKYKTPLMHVGLCFKAPYLKILGAPAVVAKKYFKSFSTLKRINIIKPNVFSSSSYTQHTTMKDSDNKNTEISIKDHYHIQFVNNAKHTVEIVHIPYYVHKRRNGKKVKHVFHTIKHIVVHLKKVFSIGWNKINRNIGKIYPFKYSRKDKTWSLITDTSDLNKTVQATE
ncbi:hypothetical protein NEIRO03_2452, partial [Nematocida sp. AWRm78]